VFAAGDAALCAEAQDAGVEVPDDFTVRNMSDVAEAANRRQTHELTRYLLEEAFVHGPGGPELSDTFLHGVHASLSFAANPMYAVLHEPCYAQQAATRWAAERTRPADFDPANPGHHGTPEQRREQGPLINGLKDRLLEAMTDSPRNKARRMRVMRRQVFENDIEKWASTFLDDLKELNGARPANRAAG
jgi:hypothetical protein